MAEKEDKPSGAPDYAPDKVSDVADWGDRKSKQKLFGEMTPKELKTVEAEAKKIGKLPHQL